MKLNDAIFGILLLLLGSSVLMAVRNFPSIPGQQVGPALFPGLIATGLCVGGFMLLVRGWRERHSVAWVEMGDWVRSRRHVLACVTLIGTILFYIVASQALGFLLCSVIILSVLFLVLEVPPSRAVLIAVVATLVIHLGFYKLLRVPLPWGVLQGIAW